MGLLSEVSIPELTNTLINVVAPEILTGLGIAVAITGIIFVLTLVFTLIGGIDVPSTKKIRRSEILSDYENERKYQKYLRKHPGRRRNVYEDINLEKPF